MPQSSACDISFGSPSRPGHSPCSGRTGESHCGTIQTYALRAQLKIEVAIGHTACGKLISRLWLAGILRGLFIVGADQYINAAALKAVRAQASTVARPHWLAQGHS